MARRTTSFTINRVSNSTAPMVVEINGAPMEVTVPQVEVELVDPTGQNGTLLMRYRTPDERAYAVETFVEGEAYTLDI